MRHEYVGRVYADELVALRVKAETPQEDYKKESEGQLVGAPPKVGHTFARSGRFIQREARSLCVCVCLV